jgi:hypothetical protein
MPTIRIPTGDTVLPSQAFTPDVLGKALEELCDPQHAFTGVVSIRSGSTLHLLFLFQNRPYAAGKSIGDKPSTLTIREFLHDVGQLADTDATIAIHASDPVLLKSLLIFIQGDPTAKAPANLINLEVILDQIRRDRADALIILENRQMFNLFYFRDGDRGIAYFSDIDFHDGEGLPFDEQLLVYAFQSPAEVNALIYRDITTKEASDPGRMEVAEMQLILRRIDAGQQQPEKITEVQETSTIVNDLVLEVLNGPLQGERLHGAIPCVLGREEADISVADPMVSNRHAAVQVVNDTLMLVDLNSTTGTTLNGTHVVQHLISEGDVIGIGATALKVVRLNQP